MKFIQLGNRYIAESCISGVDVRDDGAFVVYLTHKMGESAQMVVRGNDAQRVAVWISERMERKVAA